TKMSSTNDVSMEEIPLEDNEQDSVEYRILMAYAQRRLPANRYKKLQKNANAQKSSPSVKSEGEIRRQRDESGPSQMSELQHGTRKQQSKKQPKQKFLSRYCLPFFCSKAEQQNPPKMHALESHMEDFSASDTRTKSLQKRSHQEQTSEKADVNHIADKLAKLVTTRPQPAPSNVKFKMLMHTQSLEQDGRDGADENGVEGNDEEKTIQTIVALIRKSGDQLEEKFKKDRTLYQRFEDLLSYAFFERLTDMFLEDVSADSMNETENQLQCTKVAFAMEVATRLTAVDNHPMNLVMGFGLKYLQEHFSPWIRDQGGWDKALSSLDEEEVE
ncbi:B2L14 protein, partial [Penelope pileata]|nr:B2L14 protein [Penelope pileata]